MQDPGPPTSNDFSGNRDPLDIDALPTYGRLTTAKCRMNHAVSASWVDSPFVVVG